jgi:hypothetical protein
MDVAIVMRVDIDEAGGHQVPLRIDLFRARSGDLADRADPPALDRDITFEAVAARSIDDRAAAYDEVPVRHRCSPVRLMGAGVRPRNARFDLLSSA